MSTFWYGFFILLVALLVWYLYTRGYLDFLFASTTVVVPETPPNTPPSEGFRTNMSGYKESFNDMITRESVGNSTLNSHSNYVSNGFLSSKTAAGMVVDGRDMVTDKDGNFYDTPNYRLFSIGKGF